MSTYWGPRVLLAAVACLYGTNFPLGAIIMDHALPVSAATRIYGIGGYFSGYSVLPGRGSGDMVSSIFEMAGEYETNGI
jgi:hypothetical protein